MSLFCCYCTRGGAQTRTGSGEGDAFVLAPLFTCKPVSGEQNRTPGSIGDCKDVRKLSDYNGCCWNAVQEVLENICNHPGCGGGTDKLKAGDVIALSCFFPMAAFGQRVAIYQKIGALILTTGPV